MAKKSVKARELKRRKLCKKYKSKRDALKALIMSLDSSAHEKWDAQIALQKLPRDSAKVRCRSRCRITGRPRGVLKKFGLAHIKLREIAMRGEIPGLVKSSW